MSATPQSIADVESLIQRLYQPNEPYVIIQQQLQELQKSSEGWQLADALLSSIDANVRFFGALTFTVKLNGSFDEETAAAILERLKYWLRSLVNDIPLVVNKFMTALVTYCLRTPVLWQHPHQDLINELGGLPELSRAQLVALLTFSGSLTEEMYKMEHSSHAQLHAHMEQEVIVATQLMALGLQTARKDALHCFSMWTNYGQQRWSTKPAMQQLQHMTTPMIQCLVDPEVEDEALSVFADLLESYTTFFNSSHFDLIAEIINKTYDNIELTPQSCHLVVAYGIAIIDDVVINPQSFRAQAVFKQMIVVLEAPFAHGDEDDLTILTIEFWNAFVEYVAESSESGLAHEYVMNIMNSTVHLVWRKLFIPNDLEIDDDFKACRTDIADLVMMMYMCLGKHLLDQVVALVLQSIDSNDWQGTEAAVFLLNAIADNALEDETTQDSVASILQPLFTTNFNNFVRRTIIDMVGEYGQVLQQKPQYIPDAVRYLFSSLSTPVANVAARSIYQLCSTCRSRLTGDLEAFIRQYRSLEDVYVKEKVIGGIAAIVQALPVEKRVEPLLMLIASVEGQGLTTLQCLAAIGKGSQEPEGCEPVTSDFWQTTGKVVQDRVIGCFVLDGTGEAIDAVCQILRSGYTEVTGPFVFPPVVTIDLLRQCTIDTPQVESVLSVVAILITQYSRIRGKRLMIECEMILDHLVELVRALGHPSQDPSISSNCLDIITRLLRVYSIVVRAHEALEYILNFSLQAIEAPDITPKRSALDMWAKLLKDRDNTPIVQAIGPLLVQTLIRQVAGVGQRSDLDAVNEPLKVLFSEWPAEAKQWTESALWSQAFPEVNSRVGDVEKRRYLAQLVALRGGSKVKEVNRDFYAACRGVVSTYS